jgi:2-polyprenyl-6-methoxyphenol hydroxylase-like FAD-dependent oxidoreductase
VQPCGTMPNAQLSKSLHCQSLVQHEASITARRIMCQSVNLHALQNQDAVNIETKTVTLLGPNGLNAVGYDLLIGADGALSQVRLAMVKADRTMSSEVSYVGPMRYVTAPHLGAHPEWPQDGLGRLTDAPLDALMTEPQVTTSGAAPSLSGHSCAQLMVLRW